MSDAPFQSRQAKFDPRLLGEALKRRFPVREDGSFSALLAQLDAVDGQGRQAQQDATARDA